MAQLNDILELERKRISEGPFTTIYLFQEGSFYRAYEWSAWLCCRYISQFKTTRRNRHTELTDDATVVFIGFPVTSLSKYLPEESEMVSNNDKTVVVTLPLSVFHEIEDASSLANEFHHWKNSQPIAPSKKGSLKEALKNGVEMPPQQLSEIMLKILAFPVEQKTPMECMLFVSEIKQDMIPFL